MGKNTRLSKGKGRSPSSISSPGVIEKKNGVQDNSSSKKKSSITKNPGKREEDDHSNNVHHEPVALEKEFKEVAASSSKKIVKSHKEEHEADEHDSDSIDEAHDTDDDDDDNNGSDEDDDENDNNINEDSDADIQEEEEEVSGDDDDDDDDDEKNQNKNQEQQDRPSKVDAIGLEKNTTAHDTNGTVVDNDKNGNKNKNVEKNADEKEEDDDATNILTNVTFESLGIVDTLVEACDVLKWKTATRIQCDVLPEALNGRDIIGLAETGSGKTGAFCLPILQGLLKNPIRGGVAALILTPTRELAFQIHNVVQGLGQTIGATSTCIVGGIDRTSQAISLARNPHVVIATPGRLLDHIKDTKGFHLRNVRYLVLDEADRMLSMDFEEELHQIIDQLGGGSSSLSTSNQPARQTMLFSATMTSQVQKLQRASLRDPVRVEVSTKFQTPKTLIQSYLFVPAKYKDCYFTYIVNELAGQSILVFAATCNNVQRLALMLRNLGFPAVCLHGQMNQAKRLGALQKFAAGQRSILVCTDVASRGLDLPNVDVVVNYDLPGHGKEYIHRVGRTARAGKAGNAIAMVTQYDVEVYQRIEVLLGKKLPEYPTDEETVLILLERVNEAQRLATRELKEQLATKGGQRGAGGRRRPRGLNQFDDHDTHQEDPLETIITKEIKKSYGIGSGGRGGALPNQRGSAQKQHQPKESRGGHGGGFKKRKR